MVEGHGVHRVAASARRHLVGKRFTATSPNGRFAHGAEVIDAKELKRVEAIGKNLFYFFNESDGPEAHVMHVHFGMSGRFATHHALPGPDPTATTRLRLESKEHGICALLSAMTVDIGDCTLFQTKRAKLGEDPLREDADADRLWEKFTKSRKSVGLALMDQAMFAGVGNIYRAEILYKSGVHPEQPCTDLSRSDFDEVWRHSVELLQRGFVTGSILTVDPEEAKVLGEPWTRRYVYNQRSCGRCGDAVKTWDMANRTVYCCEGCQPLLPSTRGLSERASVRTKDAKAHVPFVSHCAAESPGTLAAEPEKLTVAKLKEILDSASAWPQGLRRTAKKAELVAAVRDMATGGYTPMTLARHGLAAETPSPAKPKPKPGVRGLEGVEASALAAAAEKRQAGEKGNVEHVALVDDESIGRGKGKRGAGGAPVTPETMKPTRAVRRRASP
jgi:formamidopyrimidine-DNA glycosylase